MLSGRRAFRSLWLATSCLCAVLISSCSSHENPGTKLVGNKETEPDRSSWHIKILAGEPGRQSLVHVGPAPEVLGGSNSMPSKDALRGTELLLGTKANINTPDGSTKAELENLSTRDGWLLVAGAAAECGMVGERINDNEPRIYQFPTIPPWQSGRLFIFPPPRACDDVVAHQQTLLCIADRLNEIADSTATVTWERTRYLPSDEFPPGPWTIPVQSNDDRFIVRELAIHVLAHIVWFDTYRLNGDNCTTRYSFAVESEEYADDNKNLLFYAGRPTPIFAPADPVPSTPMEHQELARQRLLVKAHILRDGARKLRTLIEKSFYGALGGAEKRRANAGDPLLGMARYWGVRENGQAPYNSIAHAVRILTGRWEMGANGFGGPDPRCGGITAMDLLSRALPEEYELRKSERETLSEAQEKAVALIDGSGIVVPQTALEGDINVLRAAIADQFVANSATRLGFALDDQDFRESSRGRSIDITLEKMSDEDLRFALRKAMNVVRLIVAPMEDPAWSFHPALTRVLAPPERVAKSFANLGGVVFSGGLPRAALATDVMARAGGLQVASQCGFEELPPSPDFPVGDASALDADTLGTPEGGGNTRIAFQDVFAMANAFRQRLVAIEMQRSFAESDAVAVTRAAAAEVRAWAGAGAIIAKGIDEEPESHAAKQILIQTVGFEPKDWGVDTVEEMKGQIMLVHGPAWVAQCAARLTAVCPPQDELKKYIAYPYADRSTITTLAGSPTQSRRFGSHGTLARFQFPGVFGGPNNFVPRYWRGLRMGSSGNRSELGEAEHLYVVIKHDPDAPSDRGRVLGALDLRGKNRSSAVIVSDLQRKLLNEALGVNKQCAFSGERIGGRCLESSGNYCLPGVPWDLFVPLENELTSDSDQYENSWKHYISLAKQSAMKADELGQKLLDVGLERDYRREGAQEELAGICGDYGVMSDVQVQDGKVTPKATSADSRLRSCLQEEKVDVVFLTEDQVDLIGAARARGETIERTEEQLLREDVLQCKKDSTHRLCQNDEFGKPKTISHAGLNLAKAQALSPARDMLTCQAITDLAKSLKPEHGGFDAASLDKVSIQPWLRSDRLRQLVSMIRIESVNSDNDFRLLFQGRVIMDSRDTSVQKGFWPGDADGFMSSAFNALFNAYPRADRLAIGDREAKNALLRWRIEGALWLLGGMAGTVPGGMFMKYIPAVNFNNETRFRSDVGGCMAEVGAPLLTVYGKSRFDCKGTSCTLTGEPNGNDRILGVAEPIRPMLLPKASSEIPKWLSSVYYYDATRDVDYYRNAYLHIRAENESYSLQQPNEFGTSAFLSARGRELAGLKCTAYFGGGPGAASPGAASKAIGEVKLPLWKIDGEWSHPICTPGNVATPSVRFLEDRVLALLRDEARIGGNPVYAPQDLLPLYPFNRQEGEAGYPGALSLFGKHYADFWACASYNNVGAYCLLPQDLRDRVPVVGDNVWSLTVTRRMLLPQVCGPEKRLKGFVNSYPPEQDCGAATQLVQALAMACYLDTGATLPQATEPPKIRSLEDMALLKIWIDAEAERARLVVSRIYLEDVPKRVIEDLKAGRVTSGSSDGEHGRTAVDMGSSVRGIRDGLRKIGEALSKMSTAIDSARNQVVLAGIQEQTRLKDYAIRKMQIHLQQMQLVSDVMQSWMPSASSAGGMSWNPGAALVKSAFASPISQNLEDQSSAIDDLGQLAGDEKANRVVQTFIDLQLTAQPIYQELEAAITLVQDSAAQAIGAASQLRESEAKASYEVAKGLGADYFKDANGKIVDIPVNTVLRREYDINKRRYERALADAKYLAFTARLAIEQRIGKKLNTLREAVGPLPPPALWADDVCNLQGVDYGRLKTFRDADGGAPSEASEARNMADFADQFVGDYVAKLENFVEYYNIAFPSHDGDDTAVLSLRDELLTTSGPCSKASPNLLYLSSRLNQSAGVSENGQTVLKGWETNACDTSLDRCLRPLPAAALPDLDPSVHPGGANLPPAGQAGGGITWLREAPLEGPATGTSTPTLDAGAEPVPGGAADNASGADAGGIPRGLRGQPRMVWQTVHLEGGAYVLSWWDQARDEAGMPLSDMQSLPSTLQVGVYDGDWNAIEIQTFTPYRYSYAVARTAVCDDAGACRNEVAWSPQRRTMRFRVEGGDVRIGFMASLSGQKPGSVTIANVQLEQVMAPDAEPGPYFDTSVNRTIVSNDCKTRSADDLQAAFEYRCESQVGCFYELKQPILIDTNPRAKVASRVNSKLARGNFNFRHITAALNLVGTGVQQCKASQPQSCGGSGYIEYTLNHDAFNTGIVGWDDVTQSFNFGSAAINRGKALAIERYVTMPVGSADQQLLAQAGIEKPELRGRPLDGSYRLRIWDSPGLSWNQLQDIQLILKYRYWSAIQRQAGSQ